MQPDRSMPPSTPLSSALALHSWSGPAQSLSYIGSAEMRSLDQQRWVALCTSRLVELRPHDDEDVLVALANDLWHDVGAHDPEIAAEMEHETLAAF